MSPNESQIRGILRDVLDPELGINIVDLGLLRDLSVDGESVRIRLVMTSPACPLGETLIRDIQAALLRSGVPKPAEIEIVRDPPWTPDCMTDDAKRQLGWPSSTQAG